MITRAVGAVVATPAALEAKSATNVVRSGTLLAIVPKVVVVAATAAAMEVGTAVVAADEVVAAAAEVAAAKHATLAAGSVTCLATAPKVKSATTVSRSHLSGCLWS